MLAAFIDESYLEREDVFALACVLVDGPSLASLCAGLDEVASDAVGYGVSATAELHAYEMFHGTGEWEALHGKARAQVALYQRALRAIAMANSQVLLRWTKHSDLGADSHSVTLTYLVEEVDRMAAERDEHVLIICDAVSEDDQHRASLRQHKLSGTGGYKPSKLPRILDTMHFADSHDSRGLQAADLVAFLYRRRLRNQSLGAGQTDERERKAVEAVWGEIQGSVIYERRWP